MRIVPLIFLWVNLKIAKVKAGLNTFPPKGDYDWTANEIDTELKTLFIF